MKSTLLNMTAVLFGITLIASAGVGAVNMITAEPIAQAEQAAKTAALKVADWRMGVTEAQKFSEWFSTKDTL